MPRTREGEALAILREELDRVGWPRESAFTVRRERRAEAASLDWWLEKLDDVESSTTPRNRAYLRAYVRIARELPLRAEGIQLEGRRLWMDRSVMKRLYRDGYVDFIFGGDARFVLTERGERFLEGAD